MRLIDAYALYLIVDELEALDIWVSTASANKFKRAIKECPTVDAEPVRHGRWNRGVCSECNFDWRNIAPTASVMDYCPNCGANMKGKQNETDRC